MKSLDSTTPESAQMDSPTPIVERYRLIVGRRPGVNRMAMDGSHRVLSWDPTARARII